MYFPQSRKEILPETPPWRRREFLTMVASKKRAFPRRSVRNLRDLRREWIRRRDPWMASDLYPQRLRAIAHFSARPGFHMYGYGWGGVLEDEERLVSGCLDAVYQGETPDKVATLSGYRFALCFENTRFPGYVTEKIFDSFFAGTIPVYYGAPDIADFVPEGTFVDFSRYGSFDALDDALRGFGEDAATRTLDAIRSFLRSEAFGRFTEDRFARSLVKVFRDVAAREGLL
jgi:glycosyltransferase involved in cell wall biosynthesis